MTIPESAPQDTVDDAPVELERSGGFAGVTVTSSVQRSQVPEHLLSTVHDTLTAPPQHAADAPAGADRFSYVLSHDGRSCRFSDADLDSGTRALVGWMMAQRR